MNRETTFATVKIFTEYPFSVNLPDYPIQVEFAEPQDITLRQSENGISASFNSNGLLKSMTTANSDENVPIHLEFMRYGARKGQERSGAYLFLPDGMAVSFKRLASTTVLVTKGVLESSIATGLSFATHESILRENENAIEIRNTVDIGDMSNTEIIMRMSSGIKSNDIFYTDLNAFEFVKRKRFDKLPIQANYYPIPSGIYIEDDNLRMTLLTAQPLGGTSLKSGQIEIMQDRRLDQDDNRGLGQGVLDNKPVMNLFKLSLENVQDCMKRSQNYRGGYLTMNAQTEGNRLIHPMEKLVWHENDWIGVLPTFGEKRVPLEIGTEIAILRNVPKIGNNRVNNKHLIGLVVNRFHLEQCEEEENDPDETVS